MVLLEASDVGQSAHALRQQAQSVAVLDRVSVYVVNVYWGGAGSGGPIQPHDRARRDPRRRPGYPARDALRRLFLHEVVVVVVIFYRRLAGGHPRRKLKLSADWRWREQGAGATGYVVSNDEQSPPQRCTKMGGHTHHVA